MCFAYHSIPRFCWLIHDIYLSVYHKICVIILSHNCFLIILYLLRDSIIRIIGYLVVFYGYTVDSNYISYIFILKNYCVEFLERKNKQHIRNVDTTDVIRIIKSTLDARFSFRFDIICCRRPTTEYIDTSRILARLKFTPWRPVIINIVVSVWYNNSVAFIFFFSLFIFIEIDDHLINTLSPPGSDDFINPRITRVLIFIWKP